MTRAALRFSFQFVLALLAGLIILAGGAIWRLSEGPVSLGFLAPQIEEAINQPGANLRIELGEPQLIWAGWDRAIDVVAPEVRILSEGTVLPVARLRSVSVGFSLEAALEGHPRLTSLDLLSPNVRLVRTPDGSIRLRLDDGADQSENDANTNESATTSPLDILGFLRSEKDPKDPLSELNRISLVDGSVILDDHATGRYWRLSGVTADFTRDDTGLWATANGHINLNGSKAGMQVTASLPHDASRVDLSVSAHDVPLSVLTIIDENIGEVDKLAHGSVTLSGSFDLEHKRHDATVDVLTELGGAHLTATIAESENAFIAEGSFQGLHPPTLAKAIPILEEISAVNLPLKGTFNFAGMLDGTVESATLLINAGEGRLVVPELLPDPVPITDATTTLNLTDGGNGIEIESLSLGLGGPRVEASGSLKSTDGEDASTLQDINLEAVLTTFPLEKLDLYWPPALASPAREWVVGNMPSARVHQASIRFQGTLQDMDPDTLRIGELGGDIDFDQTEVHYLRPMPPATDVAGHAQYDAKSFSIDVQSGRVGAATLKEGRVDIFGLDIGKENIDIDIKVNTPIKDALLLLDTDPYRLIEDLGIDPNGIAGSADVTAHFAFPLLNALKASDVVFKADAQLAGVSMKEQNTDILVEADSLFLQVNNAGLALSGPALLDSIPSQIAIQEFFKNTGAERRRVNVATRLTPADLVPHGLDLTDFTEGSAATDLSLVEMRDKSRRFDIAMDISDLAILTDDYGFEKQRSMPGNATLSIEQVPGAETQISAYAINTDGLKARGAARFTENFGQFLEFTAETLEVGDDRVALRVSRLPNDGYRIDAKGPRVEIQPLLDLMEDDEDSEEPETAEPPVPGPPISVFANIGTLTAGDARRLDSVRLEAHYDGLHVDTLKLDARVGEEHPLTIAYVPVSGGQHDLSVTSSDAGSALKALDVTDRIQGGSLSLSGTRPTPDAALEGRLTVENYTLSKAPVLAKVLEFMSLTGILSALGDSGLSFDKLEGQFSYLDGALSIEEARAYGTSLGITAEGKVDVDADTIDLNGTVATMYTISRIFENIPILNIIVGGKEGLFGANFRVRGAVEDPEVSVNPLSALAPGFIRTLFNQLPTADPDALQETPSPPGSDSDR